MFRPRLALLRPFGLPLTLVSRLSRPLTALLAVFLGGTLGYWALGVSTGRPWSLLDAAWMTSTTLTTVGYSDFLGVSDFPAGRLYTMALLVAGLGATLYSVSAVTAFIIEGHLGRLFKEARMERDIDRVACHTIICGCGETGVHVVEEHLQAGRPFVIVDRDPARVRALLGDRADAVLLLEGDATREDTLEQAGIDRAEGLVATLTSDKDNVFLVVTARYLKKDLRIVAKCIDYESVPKFRAAGATHVVSPTHIGGLRIAGHVLRPHMMDFVDDMLRSRTSARATEARVRRGSELDGKTLREANLAERAGALVIAIRREGEEEFSYMPSSDTRLEAGSVLVVIGTRESLADLEALVRPAR